MKGGTAMPQVVSVNTGKTIFSRKKPTDVLLLKEGHGAVGDGCAGFWHRQICLLSVEGIHRRLQGRPAPHYGQFFEHIDTTGIELTSQALGTRLRIGSALLEVTQIGESDLPSEGNPDSAPTSKSFAFYVVEHEAIFATVLEDGTVKAGDSIEIIKGGTEYGYAC